MGVLNVTPDSFADGGVHRGVDEAVRHGLALAAAGADVIDVGGESTRPGAAPVPDDEQMRRVLPVIGRLAAGLPEGVAISVDTRSAPVARAAVGEGASIVNDVSASLMEVAADTGAGWVAMHMQGDPTTMQDDPRYADTVTEVTAFLDERARRGRELGVGPIWVDPGIGFGKTVTHNLDLLAGIDRLAGLGFPVLIGTSRKGFLAVLAEGARTRTWKDLDGLVSRATIARPPAARLVASVATAIWAALQGASMVRVHDVAETVAALGAAGFRRK